MISRFKGLFRRTLIYLISRIYLKLWEWLFNSEEGDFLTLLVYAGNKLWKIVFSKKASVAALIPHALVKCAPPLKYVLVYDLLVNKRMQQSDAWFPRLSQKSQCNFSLNTGKFAFGTSVALQKFQLSWYHWGKALVTWDYI